MTTEIMPRRSRSKFGRLTPGGQSTRRRRLKMTEEERAAEREKTRLRNRKMRKAETPGKRAARLEYNRMRHRQLRFAKQQKLLREKQDELKRVMETESGSTGPGSKETKAHKGKCMKVYKNSKMETESTGPESKETEASKRKMHESV
ncbi:uncharacterized protein LOC113375700 isoform X2 [Ctenocephalides felis]|nr:uncharacterized protein LOC113375700 isoform X2 [Ctenocephalides felis]